MSELIELLTELSGRQKSFPDSVTIGHAIEAIKTSVPVVHGEWIIENTYPPSIGTHCDNCGWAWSNGIDAVKLNPVFSFIKTNYCPNCGAKMDGKEKRDE